MENRLVAIIQNVIVTVRITDDRIHEISRGQPELLFEKQLLMTLWCLTNIESFRSVADRFGVSKSSCWRILYRTCHRLLKVNDRYKIIAFPSGNQALRTINEFREINGFPGVLGLIDGCHIRIEKPKEFANSYINRKGFPSVLLQGICDKNKLFLDVYAGQPGSLHDARLFRKSDIYSRIRRNQIEFPEDSHLLGDQAYPLSTYLLVAFRDNGHLGPPQRYFNHKLSQVHVYIGNAFGLLKSRFRRLKFMETRRLDLVCLLIVSSCILHNICIMNGDFVALEPVDDDDEEENEEYIEDAIGYVEKKQYYEFFV